MAFVLGSGVVRVPQYRPSRCSATPLRRSRVVPQCVAPSANTTVGPKEAEEASTTDRIMLYAQNGYIPKPYAFVLLEWYKSYIEAATESGAVDDPKAYTDKYFSTLLELCRNQCTSPYSFDLFHQSVREPFDFYQFGLEFALPVINTKDSVIIGIEHIKAIEDLIAKGDNVVILSNHQSEGEPHAIDTVVTKVAGANLGSKITYMAGDRVREDVLAVPFTLGRNVLTVYSKKHINDVPELKAEKMNHNKRTIQELMRIFREGGHCLWLAPSGGRDRRSKETSRVEVSAFDPDSIETIRFATSRAGVRTHFFPMAVSTYTLLPPPETVDVEMGEKRVVAHVPVNLWFGPEMDFDQMVPNTEGLSKAEVRQLRAEKVEELVRQGYAEIGGYEQ